MAIGGSVPRRRLPQLHPVALGILGPPEPSILRLPDPRRYHDPFRAQLSQWPVEVGHSIVALCGRRSWTPVTIPFGHDGPDGVPQALVRSRADPLEHGHLIRDREPEVVTIPDRELPGMARAAEDLSDARE